MAPGRLGVMGGTFDPIHLGHLVCASEVAYALRLDEVVFVPAGRPWQKEGQAVSPGEDRYEMARLATADDDRFRVSRAEIDRDGYTYTVDTLRELAADDVELFFITGADALAQVLTWHDPEALFALATFVGASRPGYAVDATAFPDGAVTLVDTPALDISATECRSRVARGAPIRYLVPAPVADYIAARGLYARG
ncbi:MAG TPA: nicotinate-nucleotide adenylyltransferase [Frankiaceae bacterium]|nr:nicotinate-nucleotide adenylyltransferase [Frankiaceae bacterium]